MRNRGFTLIEIMGVFVIIGLLAAFVGPEIFQMFGRGQEDIAAAKCQDIHGKVSLFMSLTKTGVPDSLDELDSPITRGGDESFMPPTDDPWGVPYYIEKLGRRKFRICSAGEDRDEGTDDDICYPEDRDE